MIVSVCAAKCINGPVSNIGKPPCAPITPGFGTYMLGGQSGGFPGLNADNVPCEYIKTHRHKYQLWDVFFFAHNVLCCTMHETQRVQSVDKHDINEDEKNTY